MTSLALWAQSKRGAPVEECRWEMLAPVSSYKSRAKTSFQEEQDIHIPVSQLLVAKAMFWVTAAEKSEMHSPT